MDSELPPDPGLLPELIPEPFSATPPLTPPATNPPPPERPPYRDRGTGLVLFGVLQIILGLLAALMVPLVALGAFVSRLSPGGAMRPVQFLSGVATYGFIAATLLGLGIGSVQAKRWAHALTLVTSWYWLIMGVLVTILMTAVLPVSVKAALGQMKQAGANAPSPELSAGIMAVILTFIIVFVAFFLIVVPLAFVIFYSRNDVVETSRHRDPVERWTDQTPLPVLGASLVFFVGALYLLLTGATVPMFPFFGRYLTGIAGVICFFGMAAVDAYLAVALFRLQTAAWWIAVCTVPIRLFSMALTYARADMMQAYSRMGMSDEQLKIINSSPMFRGHVLLWWSLLSMLLFFGYLLWLRRYFRRPPPITTDLLPAQVG